MTSQIIIYNFFTFVNDLNLISR